MEMAGGQLRAAEATAMEALRSARGVAFWRAELLCLGFLRIPVVLPVAIRRMARGPRPGSAAQIVPACACAPHRRPVVEGQPDAVHG